MDGTADKSSPTSPSPSSSVRSHGSGSRRGSNMRRSTLRQQQHSLRKQTSVSSLKNSWRLKYVDFIHQLPQTNADELGASNHNKKSDAFQKLILKANEYLLNNPTVQMKTCEVITWMSPDPTRLGDSEQMTTSKKLTEGAKTYNVRGLRLWLVPQHIPKVQTLCYEDFVPGPTERITDLVNKVNSKIQKKQIKGRILSVQTVAAPVLNGRIQNSLTSWTDNVDVDSQYAFLLRLFFVAATDARRSSSQHMQNKTSVTRLIGIKDIVPEANDEGYEGFEVLIEKTNSWIRDQSDVISITNMQSVIVRKNEEMGNSCRYCMPGINNTESIEFFRILRVAFLRQETPTADSASPGAAATIYPFSYETITPQLINAGTGSVHAERLETMKETFAKVMAFLRNSGADVICAETVLNPMQLYCDDSGQPYNPMKEDEIQFLFTIRLYLSGQPTNGCRRSMRRLTTGAAGTDDTFSGSTGDGTLGVGKGGRSSPLFLRSVVTRQFKYRWLVLAVSAFTCMAIIVVLSVVYSNK